MFPHLKAVLVERVFVESGTVHITARTPDRSPSRRWTRASRLPSGRTSRHVLGRDPCSAGCPWLKVAGAAWLRRCTTKLAGLLLDITGWTQDEIDTSVALQTELKQFGAGGRVMHDPRPGAPARFDWTGGTP
ncbi:hypothetical protein [Streptomyces sp. NPDC002676]